MANLFDKMFGRTPKGSGSIAKDRLQVVLIHDRFNLPPEKLREMKEEILAVISKYVAVDRESVDIALEQRDRSSSKIRAEIPFSANRHADPDEDVPDSVKGSNMPEFLGSIAVTAAPPAPEIGAPAPAPAKPAPTPTESAPDTPTPAPTDSPSASADAGSSDGGSSTSD
jgi:cell division topological specificity factor